MIIKIAGNIINFTMTFSTSFLIMTTFFGIIEIINPIRWQWLEALMSLPGIPFTPQNAILTLSFLSLLIPAILSRTKISHRAICYTCNGKPATKEEKEYLEKIMARVNEKSKNPGQEYEYFITGTDDMNAMAVGDSMVCITRQALEKLTEDEMAGLLAHEAGHMHHKDNQTMIINYAISITAQSVIDIYWTLKQIIDYLSGIPVIGWPLFILSWILGAFIWINKWFITIPGAIVDKYGSRKNEFDADRYACEIGLGKELYAGIKKITENDQETPSNQELYASHPATRNRLKQIKEYLEKKKK